MGSLTEEQADLIVDGNNGIEDSDMWLNYRQNGSFAPFTMPNRLGSLKTLTDYIAVYTANPFPHVSEIEPNSSKHEQYVSQRWIESEARTGRWEVLYSPKK